MKKVGYSIAMIGVVSIVLGAYLYMRQPGTGTTVMGFKELSFGSSIESDVSSTEGAIAALSESVPDTREVSADMRGYQNAKYKFGLLYPKDLSVKEYVERDGAMSVTFDNAQTNQGFQIYVTPYKEKQITEARFKLDQPSGVYKEPTDVMVDNTRATMFFGQNSVMGDTREVWFIRGGYLYEVTTYKELDTWLGSIMQTWKFL